MTAGSLVTRVTTGLIAGLVLAMSLTACGKRGAPVPPEGSEFPRQYPAPRQVLPSGSVQPPATRNQPPQDDSTIFPYGRGGTSQYETESTTSTSQPGSAP